MARSLTSGISGQLTAQGAFPGFLVELTLTTGDVLRYTTLDVSFSWNGQTWAPYDMAVQGLSWDGSLKRGLKLQFGDADLSLWALVLNMTLVQAKVRIWHIYASATNEAEPVYTGRCGRIVRTPGLVVEIDLTDGSEVRSWPRTRVQQVVNPIFLLPGGTIIQLGSQRWILTRPVTAAG